MRIAYSVVILMFLSLVLGLHLYFFVSRLVFGEEA